MLPSATANGLQAGRQPSQLSQAGRLRVTSARAGKLAGFAGHFKPRSGRYIISCVALQQFYSSASCLAHARRAGTYPTRSQRGWVAHRRICRREPVNRDTKNTCVPLAKALAQRPKRATENQARRRSKKADAGAASGGGLFRHFEPQVDVGCWALSGQSIGVS